MIQQAQKFVIETNDSSDSRNVSVSMLYNKDSCFGCLIRCSSTIVVHRREKLKNMVKLIEHQNSKPPLPAFCLFFFAYLSCLLCFSSYTSIRCPIIIFEQDCLLYLLTPCRRGRDVLAICFINCNYMQGITLALPHLSKVSH